MDSRDSSDVVGLVAHHFLPEACGSNRRQQVTEVPTVIHRKASSKGSGKGIAIDVPRKPAEVNSLVVLR